MIQYFWGDDTYGAREAIGVLAEKLQAKIHFLDRSELEEKSLPSRLSEGGGLFGKVLLVVRDPSLMPAAFQKEMVDMAKQAVSGECILWDRGKVDQRSVVVKAFKKQSQSFPYLSAVQLVPWLQIETKKLGGTIEGDAAQDLVGRLGADRYQLLQELKKLALLKPTITKQAVEKYVIQGAVVEDVFRLVDCLMRQQEKEVMQAVEALLASGEPELRLLSLVAYQVRLLLLIKTGLKDRLSADEIASRFRVHPFPVKKNLSLAAQYNERRLLDMYVRIMATDFAIKQGKVDAKTGLIMLMRGFLERQAQTKTPA